MDEAARDQLRSTSNRAAVPIEAYSGDQHAVAREVPPISQHDLLHVADPEPVHEYITGQVLLEDPGGIRSQLDDTTVLDHEHVVEGDPFLARQLRVMVQLPVLAVDGHEEARADCTDDLAKFRAVGVPGHVHVLELRVEDAVGAVPIQVVDRAVDEALVAWNRPGGDHDPVTAAYVDDRMLTGREACERRHGLALAAGSQQHQAIIVSGVLEANHETVWHVQVAKLAGGAKGVAQAAPSQRDTPAV